MEQAGEKQVRNALQRGGYIGETASIAREWLENQRTQRMDDSQAEQLETAKSAKDAAWAAADAARDAAREAKTANMIATLALAAAVIAIAVSMVALFIRN